jgi:hypothetical protein
MNRRNSPGSATGPFKASMGITSFIPPANRNSAASKPCVVHNNALAFLVEICMVVVSFKFGFWSWAFRSLLERRMGFGKIDKEGFQPVVPQEQPTPNENPDVDRKENVTEEGIADPQMG